VKYKVEIEPDRQVVAEEQVEVWAVVMGGV
jgi:hypothetical protein